MRLNGRKTVIASVLLSCLLVFVAEQVLAQNPTVKGKGKLATVIHGSGNINASSQAVLDLNPGDDSAPVGTAVPLKMTFVLTDIIVSNATGTPGQFQIFANPGGSLTHEIEVGANSTFSFNFGTGLECPAEGHFNVFATGAALGYTVTGYLRKGT